MVRALALLALVVPPVAALGCQSPTAPPAPPGGGLTITLSYSEFTSKVEPVLAREGCNAGGDCHGGGIRGTYALSPANASDAAYDFDQSSLQVWAAYPDSSPLLTRPLVGGSAHSYKPFASSSDSGYVAIRQWIHHGVIR